MRARRTPIRIIDLSGRTRCPLSTGAPGNIVRALFWTVLSHAADGAACSV
ncbi:MAG: hypothetical protein NZ578_01485 [Candidatus Binatia bacterium]|nr:hypothetical protein [Candidatus Binatia bacterium]